MILALLFVFIVGNSLTEGLKETKWGTSDAMLYKDPEPSTDIEARGGGCIRDSKTYCDPKKGNCQCCWQDTYCGCWWDIEWMGGCRCRTGTRVTCHEKKNCPNRSSWTTKPFKPEQCNVGTWG